MIGRELEGRYRILSKIGEGAMGEVYLVEHLGLGRREALKVLRSSMDTPSLINRFRREARATNRLQHPNIVAMHDFGRFPDGRFYLATEFADGETLDQVLGRQGAMPVWRATQILAQLADAVDHAHSRGVIHRDLKPANLMLVRDRGRPSPAVASHGPTDLLKVLDFGVAKIIAPDDAETMADTGKGEVFGTPAYMSPEQVNGHADDPRIDIYAFGCIAFELVTGTTPFVGRPLEILNAHLGLPPAIPSKVAPEADIPRILDAVILRCLEKSPPDRFQTGAELAVMLAQVRLVTPAPHLAAAATAVKRRSHAAAMQSELTMPEPGDRWAGGEEETSAELPPEAADDIALLPTGDLDRASLRVGVNLLLLHLAEALMDHGSSDFHLAFIVANIAGTRGELDAMVGRIEELERSRDSVEQRARDGEARFRFAVSELRFEMQEARRFGQVDPDVEYQLGQLEARMAELASQAARELHSLDDRAITLAADRANREEELTAQFDTLEQLVDEIVPRFAGIPGIDQIVERLERARQALHGPG